MSLESDKVKISILITFSQQDRFIERTITSCLNSFKSSIFSYKIIVCLQSPSVQAIDTLEKIVKSSKSVSYIVNSPNENLIPLSKASLNRYMLLNQANSEYCLFLDGDDAYRINVDDGIKELDNNKHLVGCGYAYSLYDWVLKAEKEVRSKYFDGQIVTLETYRDYIHANCIVFRRQILLNAIIPIYCNDTTITRTLLHSGSIKYIDRYLMLYSVGIPSIYSGATVVEKRLSEFVINEESIKLFPEEGSFFLKKMRRLSKWNKGYTQDLDKCWEGHIRYRKLFFSKLFFKHLVAHSIFVKLSYILMLRACIQFFRLRAFMFSIGLRRR